MRKREAKAEKNSAGFRKRHRTAVCLALSMLLVFGAVCLVRADLPGDEEKITLSLLVMGQGDEIGESTQKRLQNAADQVAPNVEIDLKVLPDEQYYAALKLGLSSGEVGDFISVQPRYAGENSVIRLAEQGYLEPLSDLDLSGLDEEYLLENLGWNGEIYALGRNRGGMILGTLYNKDYFRELDLEVPDCWEEFLQCCQILQDNGITPITMGDRDSFVTQFGLYQLAANIIYPENPEYDQGLWSGNTHFTDPGTWDTVIEMYGELYKKGYMDSDSLKLGNAGAMDKFYKGAAAMTFTNEIYPKDEEHFGSFPLPGNKEGEETWVCASMASGGFGVYTGSEHRELCKEILLCYGQEYGESSQQTIPEAYSAAMEEGRRGDICNHNWPYGVENQLERLFLQYVVYGETEAEDVTKSTQEHIEQLLSRYAKESADS